MRNRNIMNSKLDNLETTLINLQRIVNTQEPIESYRANIIKAQGLLSDIKDIVESQPISPSELNRY